jgi:type I restriction enzyme R subunit
LAALPARRNKAEIDALQFFVSVPHRDRLRFADIKALAEAIKAPPRSWTPEVLWRAYEVLEKDRVRGASGERLLTDIVSLVRFALRQDSELVLSTTRLSRSRAGSAGRSRCSGRSCGG